MRIRRTYSGRMKNASGLSGAGRYECVGELTASSTWPRQRNWMRSGVAFSVTPCSRFRIPMMRATLRDDGLREQLARAARPG